MNDVLNLSNVIKDSFTQYAGAVIQSRALPDVRDMLKPSARQILYCLYTDKFTSDKPFKKTLKAIGSSMRVYIHGDSSCEGIIMRSAQPFAMRYPLMEVEGSYGNLTETSNWAAPRYTSARLSPLADYLLGETEKYCIDEWNYNYDDTEEYPRVVASKGFFNIVNGSSGIAVGIASSIPQFNLKEVNNAVIKLIQNPNIDFDDIYCEPDFATGGIIVNKNEVKKSLRSGHGSPCIIRAKIDYDNKNHVLIVKELPYSVYTNTICKEIEKLTNENPDCGIIGINDLTGSSVNIKIYLAKKANYQDVITTLYNFTSLQKSYSINMSMLENGRFPKIFGWKEILQQYIDFEKQVYLKCFKHQIKELEKQIRKLQILLKVSQNIDEVLAIYQNVTTEEEDYLRKSLKQLLDIEDDEVALISKITLSRLTALEQNKMKNKLDELQKKLISLQEIINSEELLNNEIIISLKEVADKFGDDRRTKVVQKDIVKTVKEAKKKEIINQRYMMSIYNIASTTYMRKVPIAAYRENKNNLFAFMAETKDIILVFDNHGKYYRIKPDDIKECGNTDKGTVLNQVLKMESNSKILFAANSKVDEKHPYIVFATEDGKVKKSEKSIFAGNTRNVSGMQSIRLTENSGNVIMVSESNGDYIVLESSDEYHVQFPAEKLRCTGRTAGGVAGIKLHNEAKLIRGKILSSPDSSIKITNRGVYGSKI